MQLCCGLLIVCAETARRFYRLTSSKDLKFTNIQFAYLLYISLLKLEWKLKFSSNELVHCISLNTCLVIWWVSARSLCESGQLCCRLLIIFSKTGKKTHKLTSSKQMQSRKRQYSYFLSIYFWRFECIEVQLFWASALDFIWSMLCDIVVVCTHFLLTNATLLLTAHCFHWDRHEHSWDLDSKHIQFAKRFTLFSFQNSFSQAERIQKFSSNENNYFMF